MKKFLLKNAMLIIAILLSTGTIALCIWNMRQISSNAARLDGIVSLLKVETLPEYRDSLVKELEIRKFKEDYFVEQVNIQSDWIILYVSALFILFGIFGFGTFIREYQEVKQDNEKFKEDNANKQRILHDEFANFRINLENNFKELTSRFEKDFKGLKIQHLSSQSNIAWLSSIAFLKEGLIYEGIKNGLMSVSYQIMAIREGKKESDTIIKLAIEYLTSLLDSIQVSSNAIKIAFIQHENNYEVIVLVLDEILKFDNREIRDIAIEIRAIIKIINDQKGFDLPTENSPTMGQTGE